MPTYLLKVRTSDLKLRAVLGEYVPKRWDSRGVSEVRAHARALRLLFGQAVDIEIKSPRKSVQVHKNVVPIQFE